MHFNILVRGCGRKGNMLLTTANVVLYIRKNNFISFVPRTSRLKITVMDGVRNSATLKIDPISRIQYFQFRNNITEWGAPDDKT